MEEKEDNDQHEDHKCRNPNLGLEEDNDQHEDHKCRNPNLRLATKARACEGAGQE